MRAQDIITPPEGVPISLPVAGIGVRLGAQIIDVLITSIATGALLVALFASGLTGPATLSAAAVLLFFFIRIPYYVITELIWSGQTLGKRMLKIRVIDHDGGPLTTHAVVARNLMKEAEVFLPGTLVISLSDQSGWEGFVAFAWVMMAFAIPLSNRHRRRLGDFMAGTHVVHLPEPILLEDIATRSVDPSHASVADDGFVFLSHQLDHYGAFELQTLEAFLRAPSAQSPQDYTRRKQTAEAITENVRKKIGYANPVAQSEREAFLTAFYTAQRAHLEQKQLFGDKRADKHHAQETPKS